MKSSLVRALIFLLLFTFIWINILIPNTQNYCDDLTYVVNDVDERLKIKQIFERISLNKAIDTRYNTKSGFIELHELGDEHLLKLIQPLNFRANTIKLNGNNINYLDLSQSLIESFLIGFGGRNYIIFDVNSNNEFSINELNIQEDEIVQRHSEFILVCRN